ncbi:MAG: hypothetical protein HRU05_05050 [Oceanospirillaceae bacterium]|nr:hypothetical protein [Oceanospirillaceae bacterium]
MTSDPYTKAIAQITRVLEEVVRYPHQSARSLSKACQLSPSSGYRMIKAMETQGFLNRDGAGEWVRGAQVLQVGLNAWGVGGLGYASEPVLNRLRQNSQCTAFIGALQLGKLWVGPFSLGRGANYLYPGNSSGYVISRSSREGELSKLSLVLNSADFEVTPAFNCLYLPIEKNLQGEWVVVGVLINKACALNVTQWLQEAQQRLKEVLEQSENRE